MPVDLSTFRPIIVAGIQSLQRACHTLLARNFPLRRGRSNYFRSYNGRFSDGLRTSTLTDFQQPCFRRYDCNQAEETFEIS